MKKKYQYFLVLTCAILLFVWTTGKITPQNTHDSYYIDHVAVQSEVLHDVNATHSITNEQIIQNISHPNKRNGVIVLDFEGLGNVEQILEYYNGGYSGGGYGPGPEYGVTFSGSTLSIIAEYAGGTGNFQNEPSPVTVMFFLDEDNAIMSVESGFQDGFSFYYSSINEPGIVEVYDEPEGNGLLLASFSLEPLGSQDIPGGAYNIWEPIGVSFEGIAKSVKFIGAANFIGFDDVTFGSEIPGDPETTPSVITLDATSVTTSSANIEGEVIHDGGLEVTGRGFYWGSEPDVIANGTQLPAGTGLGTFFTELESLNPNATYYFAAYAVNDEGTAYGEEKQFTTLAEPPLVTTLEATGITASSANIGGDVTYDGGLDITERGFYWGSDPDVVNNGMQLPAGTGLGTFFTELESLNPNATYYFAAYAVNDEGMAYGEEKQFTTLAEPPLVTTLEATGITASSANIGADVTYDGGLDITDRGFYWGSEPDVVNNGTQLPAGTGLGTFFTELESLNPNATYYFAAYAVNDEGTAYGEEKQFNTLAEPPTVITGDATNITFESANISGQVTFDGGANVIERGFYYCVNPNPESTGTKIFEGEGTGNFSSFLTELIPATTYYYKAFATNFSGTEHGSVESFVTDYEPVFLPNAFMPNSHITENQVFKPEFAMIPTAYSLEVFNLWGERLFISDDVNIGWDGTVRNSEAPQGTYVYKITFIDLAGEEQEYRGAFMLIR